MSKLFKIGKGALLVRKNGYGFDKKCPVTGVWSVLFLSGMSRSESCWIRNESAQK